MPTLRERIAAFLKPTVKQEAAISGLDKPVAWSDSLLYSSSDFPRYNPDDLLSRKGSEVYTNMMLDEQVKAAVHFKRDAITARNFFFGFPDDTPLSDTEQDKRIAIYDQMVKSLSGSFQDGLNYTLKAMTQGYSFTEIVLGYFEYDKKTYIGINKLMPKPFDTFQHYTTPEGEIIKTVQELDGNEQVIDLNRFIYYVQNPDKDDLYGRSELRECYRSWYSKDVIIKLWNIYLERMAGGFHWVSIKEGKTVNTNSEEYRQLQTILKTLQSASGVIMPSMTELNSVMPSSTTAYEEAIKYHDLAIAKSLLVPNLLGVSNQGDTGAYAQSATQFETFLWTLDADSDRLQEAVNEQLFAPLAKFNFADGIAPEFQFKPINDRKKFELAKAWAELVGAACVEATDTDEAHWRKLFELPEKGEPLEINRPSEAPPTTTPDGTPKEPIGGPDAQEPGEETIRAKDRVSSVSRAAFDRAKRRVHFNVIDRQSEDLTAEQTLEVEDRCAAMVAEGIERIETEKLGTPAGGADQMHKFDFNRRRKDAVRRVFGASLVRYWKLGEKVATDEINRAAGEARRLKRFEREISDAMARFNFERLGVASKDFTKDTAYRLAGNLTDAMKQIVLNVLAQSYLYSWPTKTITRKIYDALLTAGTIALETNAEATGRTAEEVREALAEAKLTPHRISTVLRTSGFSAINEARFNMFTDPELGGFVEALEYTAILDSRTTQICRHLDDRVYPVGAPEWDGYRPPNHYNCRSLLIPVTVLDSEVTGKDNSADSRWSKAPTIEPASGFGGDPES